jgi:hypothetical protein
MSAYQASAASAALCSGLLLASFIMADQPIEPAPAAQMNRAQYVRKATPEPVVADRCLCPPPAPAPATQMNRASYRR